MWYQLAFLLTISLVTLAKGHLDEFSSRWRRSNNDGNNSLVSAYYSNTQMCCSGIAFPLAPSQECCGSKTFDSKTQQCCSGIAYNTELDFKCCGDKYINTNTDVCCLSYYSGKYNIVKMPEGGTKKIIKCCGSKIYNTQTHNCCAKRRNLGHYFKKLVRNRHIEITTLNEPVYIKTMRKPAEIRFLEMLKWVPLFKIQEKIDDKKARCSNEIFGEDTISRHSEIFRPEAINRKDLYEIMNRQKVETQVKCNGEVFNHYTHVCCSVKNKDGLMESKLHKKSTPLSGCCGLELFNFEFEICCNEKKVHLQNDDATLACNGEDTYDVTQKKRCGMSSELVEFKSLGNGMDSCCGERKIAYNSIFQSCCGGTLVNGGHSHRLCCWSNDTDEEPKMYDPDRDVCCGGVLFEKAHNHECCGKQLYSRYSQLCCNNNVFSKTSMYNDRCCGDKALNTKTHACCYPCRNIIKKISKDDHDCCGDRSFNANNEVCCYTGDEATLNYTMKVLPKSSPTMECCHLTPFDTDSQKCCGDSVTSLDKQCCNYKTPFDPKIERCCKGTVVTASIEQTECCGISAYNPEKEFCCKDKAHPIDDNKNKCCNSNVYDDKKQICCRGVVKDVDNTQTASCCYENM